MELIRSVQMVSVLLLGAFASFNASATLDVKGYRELMEMGGDGRQSAEMYVNGLRDGIVLFDAFRHRYDSIEQKFCVTGTDLSGEKTLAILNLELADPTRGKPYPDDMAIAFVLIMALERFAPCK